MVIPIPRAWQVFEQEGKIRDEGIERQLRLLRAEVWRAARQRTRGNRGITGIADE